MKEPQTQDEYDELNSWERPLNLVGYGFVGGSGGEYGAADPGDLPPILTPASPPPYDGLPDMGEQIGTANPPDEVGGGNEGEDPVEYIKDRTNLYTIEIHDSDGVLIEQVEEWFRSNQETFLDAASTFTFQVVADSAHVANLAGTNRIWLLDAWGLLLSTYTIVDTFKLRRGDAAFFQVDCDSSIGRLSREVVIGYDSDASVLEHVEALFALQVQGDPLAVGAIDAAIAETVVNLTVNHGYVLGALLQLQETLPMDLRGHYFVDRNDKFVWQQALGNGTVQTLSVERHVRDYKHGAKSKEIVNRLYLFGAGLDLENELDLTSPGADQPEVYIEDAASQAIYGIRPLIKKDNRIQHGETLLQAAQRILEELSLPPVSITMNAIDLARADDSRFATAETLSVGLKYVLEDEANDLAVPVEIVSIIGPPDRPLKTRVQLKNKRHDMASILRRILDQFAAQDFNMRDRDRYPNVTGLWDGTEAAQGVAYKDGDLKYDIGELSYWDDNHWESIDAGTGVVIPYYVAATFAGLENSGIAQRALAQVIGVDDNDGKWYKRNDDNSGWATLGDIQYFTADTFDELPNTSVVPENAFAQVLGFDDNDAMWYKRGVGNVDWVPLTVPYYTATTFAGLAESEEIHQSSWAQVIGGDDDDGKWYVRNPDNGGWEEAKYELSDATPLSPTTSGTAGTASLATREGHRHPKERFDE